MSRPENPKPPFLSLLNFSERYFVDAFVLIFIIVFDQETKYLAWHTDENNFLGLQIVHLKNYFFFLSSYQTISVEIRSLVIGLAFFLLLSFIYLAVSLLGSYSPWIRRGSLLLIGGQFGNNLDRIQLNYVRDFMSFPLDNNVIFNVADIFIVLGSVLFLVGLIRSTIQITSKKNRRLALFVSPAKQLSLIAPLMGFIALSFFSPMAFLYLFLKLQTNLNIDPTAMSALWFGLVSLFILSTLWGFLLCLKWSYQILGPLHAFRRWWRAHHAKQTDIPLHLRRGDLLKELEELSIEIIQSETPSVR